MVNLLTGQTVAMPTMRPRLNAFAPSPQGRYLLTGAYDDDTQNEASYLLWNVAARRSTPLFSTREAVRFLGFDNTGRQFAFYNFSARILTVYDVATAAPIQTFNAPKDAGLWAANPDWRYPLG